MRITWAVRWWSKETHRHHHFITTSIIWLPVGFTWSVIRMCSCSLFQIKNRINIFQIIHVRGCISCCLMCFHTHSRLHVQCGFPQTWSVMSPHYEIISSNAAFPTLRKHPSTPSHLRLKSSPSSHSHRPVKDLTCFFNHVRTSLSNNLGDRCKNTSWHFHGTFRIPPETFQTLQCIYKVAFPPSLNPKFNIPSYLRDLNGWVLQI